MESKTILLRYRWRHFRITDCPFPAFVGDGSCDDLSNIQLCNFDGGDCCLPQVDTQFCYACICVSNDSNETYPLMLEPTTTFGYCETTHMINDGVCDEINRFDESCELDGKDCCKFQMLLTPKHCIQIQFIDLNRLRRYRALEFRQPIFKANTA